MDQTEAKTNFRVIDLFAGPGGLAEGFSSCHHPVARFDVSLSVEKEQSAFSTLRLRSFYRHLDNLHDYYRFANGELDFDELRRRNAAAWQRATAETAMLELGRAEHDAILDTHIHSILEDETDNVVVIGGPPCQAYSLAGRSRNAGIASYVPERDRRHFLFREYIRILAAVRPCAFVMENVKGILSSTVGGEKVFELVKGDLRNAGGPGSYLLFSLSPSTGPTDHPDFVLRAEEHGIPQSRHRVILVGVRSDIAAGMHADALRLPRAADRITVREALCDLPALRSGLSSGPDDFARWQKCVLTAFDQARQAVRPYSPRLAGAIGAFSEQVRRHQQLGRSHRRYADTPPSGYAASLRSSELERPLNHETRGHMPADLARYAYCASFAAKEGRSPTSREFPGDLAPLHASWKSGKFADRFRAQVWDLPSSTITSHISKDGHYFIHPDPSQCRSLTVREAARLQSFPDDYLFLGNRTSQYVQVGNAVPPVLARVIASRLADMLTARGLKGCETAAAA